MRSDEYSLGCGEQTVGFMESRTAEIHAAVLSVAFAASQ